MKKILFVSDKINERLYKQIVALKKTNLFQIELATSNVNQYNLDKIAEDIYFLNRKSSFIDYVRRKSPIFSYNYHSELKKLKSILKKNYDVIHIHVPPSFPFDQLIENFQCPYVIDLYDPANFYGRSRMYLKSELNAEKILHENASGIVTKFPTSLYEKYADIGINLIDKPKILFPDYCSTENLSHVQHSQSKNFSFVYCGGADYPLIPKRFAGNNIFVDICRKLLENKFNVSLISSIFNDKLIEKILNYDYLKLKKKYKKLSLYPFIKAPELQKIISRFDFGMQLHDFSMTGHDPIFGETSFGNKFFTYLEAGLPIIVNEELKWNSNWVENYDVGIKVPLNSISEIPYILKYFNIVEAKKRVIEISKSELNMDNNINKLVNFYHNFM